MKDRNNFLKSILAHARQKRIIINKEDFSFRLYTHPSYPGLLSVIETLEYFEIDQEAYEVDFTDISSLPNNFLALLKEPYLQKSLYNISKKNDQYYINNKEIQTSDLQKKWTGIIIILNETADEKRNTILQKKRLKPFMLSFAFILLFTLYNTHANVWDNIFYIFSIIGSILSIAVFKDLFKIQSPILNKFCNSSSHQQALQNDCNAVINSKKWSLFKKINYSDFSLFFFLSQIILYPLMSLLGYSHEYFSYQGIALLTSIPLIISSLYFQKYIIKKWCPFCLGIISVIIIEIILIRYIIKPSFSFDITSLNLFGFINFIIITGWSIIKQKLNQFNSIKDFQLRATRFIRNYSLFKKTILEGKKHDLPLDYVRIDTQEKLTITLITNPFCDHCKKAHFSLDKIFKKHQDRFNYNIMLNIDINDEYGNDKLLCQKMMMMLLKNQKEKFITSLNEWFENENISKWLGTYQTIKVNGNQADHAFEEQKQWCVQNQKDFTPALFINGYLYPLIYDMEHLDYFIQDLINDNDFFKENYQIQSELELA